MTRRRVLAALVFVAATMAGSGRASAQSLSAQDYAELQQLYARYNHTIDSGDAEGWASTFTPDGVFSTFNGHDALVGFAKALHAGTGQLRRHWVTNILLTPTADGAKGTCYMMLLDIGVKPAAIATTGRYEDVLVKTSNGWRFKARVVKANPAPKSAP